MGIVCALCVVLVVLVLCKWGFVMLLNIVLYPPIFCSIGTGLTLYSIINWGFKTTVLIVLGLVCIYFLNRNKH